MIARAGLYMFLLTCCISGVVGLAVGIGGMIGEVRGRWKRLP